MNITVVYTCTCINNIYYMYREYISRWRLAFRTKCSVMYEAKVPGEKPRVLFH